MQLQMTAPLDIGLEFQDQALGHGQDDILDLEMSKKQLGKKKNHGDLVNLFDDKEDFESDEGEQGEDTMDGDEALDPDDEGDKKVGDLEAELDGMYDAYQERMKDRDTKYRVKETRRKDKSREEWHGIQEQGSDDDDSDESEGGYDVMQAAKARAGEDSDSDSNSESADDVDVPFPSKTLKRARGINAGVGGRQLKKARTTRLETSRAASMWFDQDVFAGVDLTVSDDEDEDEEMHDVGDEDVSEDEEGVFQSEGSADSDDDFEVVPQEDQHEEMWGVDDEDQDEIKRSRIQSTSFEAHSKGSTNINKSYRIRSVDRRSHLHRPPAGQPGNHQNSPDQRRVQPLLPQFQRGITSVVPRRRERTLQIQHTHNERGGGRPPGSPTCSRRSSDQEDCRGQGS
jgi:AdoMet-dependent rRNA methyltransferase SPB1